MAYTAGYSQGCTFLIDGGGGGAVTLNVTGHSWEEQVADLKTTNTGSSGKATRIAGVLDGFGNVSANVDAAALVNAASPGVVAGAKGVLTFAIGGATPISVHCMVTKLRWQSSVDGLVQYNFDVALDNTSGSYTRPT